MSQTLAHRHGPHLRLPLTPVLVVLALVVVVAAGLVIINQPSTTTTTPATAVQFVGVPGPVSVANSGAALTYYKRISSPTR